jgi:multiple sugar transport system permease protein
MRATTAEASAKAARRGPRIAWLAGRVASLALLVLLSAIVLLPVGWMLTVALKPDQVPVFTAPPQWFPTQFFEFDNFVRTMTNPLRPFGLYILNTTLIFAWSVVGMLLSCSLAGYAFARMRFRWRNQLFWLLIVTMLIPWQVLIVPQFLIFHSIGFYGTYLPLIVPAFFGNAFYIFLIRQYMRTIPRELDEAARIDGAGHLRIFWSVILPLSKPVLAVVAVFVFLGTWNDLLGPLIYLNNNDQFTVALGLANAVTRAGTDWNLVMAANLLMMVPPVVIYFALQRQLVGGISSVGIKG